MLRDEEDSRILLVVNNSRHHGAEVELSLRGSGRLEVWDLLSGTIQEVATVVKNGNTCFQDSFDRPTPGCMYSIRFHKNERHLKASGSITGSSRSLPPLAR